MSDALFEALADCLKAIEAGADPQAVLAHYPALADELRPLLAAAQAARPAEALRVPARSQAASRARFLAQAADLRRARPRFGLFSRWSLTPRLGLALLAGLAAIWLGTTGLVAAAAQSLPGDPLYGVKRAAEQVEFTFASESARAELEERFEQNRLTEAQAVMQQRRLVAVEFSGLVEQQAGENWQVAGLNIVVPTEHAVSVQVGQRVHIEGVVQADGGLVAESVNPRPATPAAPRATLSVGPTQTETPSMLPPASATALPALKDTEPAVTEPSEVEPADTATPRPAAARTEAPATATPRREDTQAPPARLTANSPMPQPTNAPPATETARPAAPTQAKPEATQPAPATSEPRGTETPEPTRISDDHQPTAAPLATATERPRPTDLPPATETPRPAEPPPATAEATQASVEFEGRVEAIGSVWTIAGQAVTVTDATEIRDNPRVGDTVRVSAWQLADGQLVARRIERR